MIRILHIYKTSFPDTNGGVEKFIHELALNGSKIGLCTYVLTLSKSGLPKQSNEFGYEIYREKIDFEIFSNPISFKFLEKYNFLITKVDILHFHFPWPFMDLVYLSNKIKKTTVVTYHSDIIKQKYSYYLYKSIMSLFLNKVDIIIATSDNYLKSSRILQNYINKVQVIPIGISIPNNEQIRFDKIEYWKNKLANKFYLFVGVMRYYKGLETLIKSFIGIECILVIIGSGPLEKKIKNLVDKYKLSNIIILGKLKDEDKYIIYKLCYAVVLPSDIRSEAFGISLIEGAMFGKPLISCEINTGTSYININDLNGIVVKPQDYIDLKKAIIYLWNNPDIALKMGIESKKRYENLFTSAMMVSSYKSIYMKLLNIN